MDYCQLSLTKADFSGKDLTDRQFVRANLENANFAGANLTRANFSRANLTGANFSGANLSESNFFLAIAQGCDFSGANLRSANLERGEFQRSNFSKAFLNLTNFFFAKLDGASLREAKAYCSRLSTSLVDADLTGINLTGSDFSSTVFTVQNKIRGVLDIDQQVFVANWIREGINQGRISQTSYLPPSVNWETLSEVPVPLVLAAALCADQQKIHLPGGLDVRSGNPYVVASAIVPFLAGWFFSDEHQILLRIEEQIDAIEGLKARLALGR